MTGHQLVPGWHTEAAADLMERLLARAIRAADAEAFPEDSEEPPAPAPARPVPLPSLRWLLDCLGSTQAIAAATGVPHRHVLRLLRPETTTCPARIEDAITYAAAVLIRRRVQPLRRTS